MEMAGSVKGAVVRVTGWLDTGILGTLSPLGKARESAIGRRPVPIAAAGRLASPPRKTPGRRASGAWIGRVPPDPAASMI